MFLIAAYILAFLALFLAAGACGLAVALVDRVHDLENEVIELQNKTDGIPF